MRRTGIKSAGIDSAGIDSAGIYGAGIRGAGIDGIGPSPVRQVRWHKSVAALFASLLLAVACAPDGPDAALGTDDQIDVAETAAPTTSEAPGEGDDEPAENAGPADDADDATQPANDPRDNDPTDTEPSSPDDETRAGAFDNYDPTDLDATPLPVDPAVLIGELPNGLAYYLRSNDSPGGSVVMHLVVNAGAVLDPVDKEGTAHFLEHMLFNGTERFSKNELDQALRDLGTDFGPDLNAYTSADETVYSLDVLLDDPEAIQTAFTVLSEWASAATILPADVEDERGIILDEYRLSEESADGRISNLLNEIYYRGTVYEGIQVGGSLESNSAITAEDLRDFYETWYRPDNMAVVVVGDVPVLQLEALVADHFADFSAPTPAVPAQPDRSAFTVQFVSEPFADVITHPDHGSSYVSLDWQLPAWPNGTVGGERLIVMEEVIAQMLGIRLDAAYQAGLMAQATQPRFLTFPAARGLRLYGTNYQGSDLAQATTDFVSVVAGAAHFGFTPDELNQAVESLRTSARLQLETAETRQDAQYASRYTQYFLSGADISSESTRFERLTTLLDTYSVEELTAHLRWLLDRASPLAVSIGPDPSAVPTAQELLSAIDAASPLAPPAAAEAVESLMERPAATTPSSEAAVDLFEDAYEWRFPNGARVVFVPSNIASGEVDVVAESLGGWSTLSVGDAALVGHAAAAVAASGVGDISATQLDEYLAANTARVVPFIDEFSEGFSGTSSPDDLETLFALMHLYITQPRVSEVAVGEQIQAMQTRLANSTAFPQWISELKLLAELHQGSPWYQFIAAPAQIDATTAESLLGLYQARLSDVDDLMVVVVGDIDRSAVADLVARYIGSLPAGASDTFENRRPGFPSGVRTIKVPIEADSGTAGFDILFGATAPVNTASSVIAEVAQAVLNDLLTVRVREELGDTYSVVARVTPNATLGTWQGRILSSGAPAGLNTGHSEIMEILRELIANGPTQRDLAQAIAVVGDNYALVSNPQIVNSLRSRHHLDDADIATPARRRAALPNVTGADVQQFIALLFDPDNRVEVFRAAE